MSSSTADDDGASVRTVLEGLNRDLKLAIRSLRRSPGFTIAAIAILALGIGMSTAMFATYRAVLIDRLPVADQARLIVMHPLDRGGAHLDVPFAYLKTIERDSTVFAGATGAHHLGSRVAPYLDGDVTIPLSTATVAGNFFDVLGSRPLLGRGLRPSDAEAGAPIVVVLSFDAWRKKFHQDSSIVGHVLTSTWDGSRITIVGVAPPGLEFPTGSEVWIPSTPAISTLQVDLVVRLRPHVSIDAARTALNGLIDRENPFNPSDARAVQLMRFSGVVAQPFDEEIVGKTRPVLVALTLAVGLLLLIACVNVGNLVLVRTSGRMNEIAVRRAIGASYVDVARQFFVENTVLAVLGGIGGVACALAALRVLVFFAPPQLPRVEIIRLGGVPLAAGAATTFVAVLIFGIAPSLMAASSAPYAVLRSDARGGSEGSARRRARRWLVSSQMALALVMLAGAGLLARSLNELETLHLGYTPAHLSLLSFEGSKSIFASPKQIIAVADQLIARIRAVPGVLGVTPVESEPFMGTSFFIMKLSRAEQRGAEAEANPHVPFEAVGPDYFRTLDIPIIRGRGILESDRAEAPQVVVLSESLAKFYWPNEDPIGKKLRSVFDTTDATITVVGVARDTHLRTLRDVAPIVYVPYHQMGEGGFWNGYLMIRTQSELSSMIPAIRRATKEVAPGLGLWQTHTMDQELDGPLAQPRLGALLLAGFSAVALVLAAIGLYGVMSSTVRQQTRDLGIRLALGATARDVRRLVLGEAMRVVLIGAGIGVVVALLSTRLLASLLFGVRALDPISFISAGVVLIAIGALAAFFPARRATRIDPARALRSE